jgi:predicted RNA binding protein YcfA (HicA-like mRNA interferase family)
VKRTEFIKELAAAGCFLKRHGKKHDIYVNPTNGTRSPVPRHKEIKNSLCELIRKQLGIGQNRS